MQKIILFLMLLTLGTCKSVSKRFVCSGGGCNSCATGNCNVRPVIQPSNNVVTVSTCSSCINHCSRTCSSNQQCLNICLNGCRCENQNIARNTEVIQPEIRRNDEIIETVNEEVEPKRCCDVLHPDRCYQDQSGNRRCVVRKHRECSDLCSSSVVSIQQKQEARPSCYQVRNYPYVYCGQYEKQNCGQCQSQSCNSGSCSECNEGCRRRSYVSPNPGYYPEPVIY